AGRDDRTGNGVAAGRVPDAEPRSLAEARSAIEHTRDRLSGTLDALDDRMQRARRRIRAKAEAVSRAADPLRRRPLAGMAIAFGVGVFLGRMRRRGARRG